jgi:hypothetical protein
MARTRAGSEEVDACGQGADCRRPMRYPEPSTVKDRDRCGQDELQGRLKGPAPTKSYPLSYPHPGSRARSKRSHSQEPTSHHVQRFPNRPQSRCAHVLDSTSRHPPLPGSTRTRPVGSEAAAGGRSRKPSCYRMCHSLKDRSTLSFPPVSTHAWILPTGPRFDMLVSQVLPNQLEIGRVVRHERCP